MHLKGDEQSRGRLDRPLSRRQAIKAGGIGVVGLAFAQPLVETIYPKPAFAGYVTINNADPKDDSLPISHNDGSDNSSNLGNDSGGGDNGGGNNGSGGDSHGGAREISHQGAGGQSYHGKKLEPLGDNLVRVWEFNNGSKEWSFYGLGSGRGGVREVKDLVPGRAYFLELKRDQRVVLNGKERSLFAGWNCIVW